MSIAMMVMPQIGYQGSHAKDTMALLVATMTATVRAQPFAWTKPADQILAKLNRQTTSATEH